jgi:hypothetical protein
MAMNHKNLADAADAYQIQNHIHEDLLVPAATFALALVDRNGNVVSSGQDLRFGIDSPRGGERVARVTFDPSADTTRRTIAGHASTVKIPSKAIITKAWYEVITTFTSATDAATIAMSVEGPGDVLAAIAISDATNPHDAGIHGAKPGYPNFGADAAHDSQVEVAALFAGTFLKLTADRFVTFTVAVEALTAGKLALFIHYVMGN